MATRNTIAKMVSMLFSAPLANKPTPEKAGANVVDETTVIYWLTLRDLDDELLMAATIHLLATSKWFPAPADLRDVAAGIIQRADNVPSAADAWGEVTKWFSRCGSWGVPEFSHPLIGQAVDGVGGWMYLCRSESQAADRARFMAAYDQYRERSSNDAMMLPAVAGYLEKRRELAGASIGELVSGLAAQLEAA